MLELEDVRKKIINDFELKSIIDVSRTSEIKRMMDKHAISIEVFGEVHKSESSDGEFSPREA